MTDKLRLLLIDDSPSWAIDSETGQVAIDDSDLDRYVEAFVISNVSDMKRYFEGFSLIDLRDPALIGRFGLVPEILIFDYSLLQAGLDSSDDAVPPPLLQRLRGALDAVRLTVSPANVDGLVSWPPDKDMMGCYLGISLARAFGAHPCGSIPTTAVVDVASMSADARFFEWLHGNDYLVVTKSRTVDAFVEKHRVAPELSGLISLGAQALRQRLCQLLGAGIVAPSLAGLMELTDRDGLTKIGEGLPALSFQFRSRYGPRAIPLGALFADSLRDGRLNTEEVTSWAKVALDEVSRTPLNVIEAARGRAEAYYRLGNSWESEARYAFSEIVAAKATGRVTAAWPVEVVKELESIVGVSVESAVLNPQQKPFTRKPHMITDADPDVLRIAALFLCVLLERRERLYRAALPDLDEIRDEWAEGLGGYPSLKPAIPLKDAANTWSGKPERFRAVVRLLLDHKLGKIMTIDGVEYLVRSENPDASRNRSHGFYRLVDPLPETLLTFEHKKREKGEHVWEPDTTTLHNQLKRVGLQFGDVVRGRPEDKLQPALSTIAIVPGARFSFASDEPGVYLQHEGHILSVKAAERQATFGVADYSIPVSELRLDRDGRIAEGLANVYDAIQWKVGRPLRFEDGWGLRPGEGQLLRAFATGIGFHDGQPDWLQKCP